MGIFLLFMMACAAATLAGVFSNNPGVIMGLYCVTLALRCAAEVIAAAIRETKKN